MPHAHTLCQSGQVLKVQLKDKNKKWYKKLNRNAITLSSTGSATSVQEMFIHIFYWYSAPGRCLMSLDELKKWKYKWKIIW